GPAAEEDAGDARLGQVLLALAEGKLAGQREVEPVRLLRDGVGVFGVDVVAVEDAADARAVVAELVQLAKDVVLVAAPGVVDAAAPAVYDRPLQPQDERVVLGAAVAHLV